MVIKLHKETYSIELLYTFLGSTFHTFYYDNVKNLGIHKFDTQSIDYFVVILKSVIQNNVIHSLSVTSEAMPQGGVPFPVAWEGAQPVGCICALHQLFSAVTVSELEKS